MPDPVALPINPLLPARDLEPTVRVKDAAAKFESLLIAQMLKSARQSDSGGWSGETDQAGSAAMDMAEQQLADLLGSSGALGIARMVVEQLGKKE
jgi:Rod binding domain-containing protein